MGLTRLLPLGLPLFGTCCQRGIDIYMFLSMLVDYEYFVCGPYDLKTFIVISGLPYPFLCALCYDWTWYYMHGSCVTWLGSYYSYDYFI